MTIEEFEALFEKANRNIDKGATLDRLPDGTWNLIKQGPADEDVYHGTIADVVAKLEFWATPPKPSTLALVVPFEAVEYFARDDFGWSPLGRIMHNACVEAMKPYQPS